MNKKIYKGIIDITIDCNEQEWIIDINKGSIYNMKEYFKPQFLKMFEALEKLGYIEEFTETINNFQFEYMNINDFIPCLICTADIKHKNSESCKNCKFLYNLLAQDNDAYTIKSTEEINNKIINLIKSL